MKKVVHKISAVLMTLVVLFSTMSFTMHMHYCGDTLVDSSYFEKADSCGMEMPQPASSSDCEGVQKNCCADKEFTLEGQDELSLTHELQMEQKVFAAIFINTYIQLFESPEESKTADQHYLPPPLVKPIHKLDETYLI